MIRTLLPAGVLVAGAAALATTDGSGDPAFGRRLADDLCSECHVVSPAQNHPGRRSAPDLTVRVRDPVITETALRSYLQTSHTRMPNIMLSQEQMDDIIAYLLSLKGGTQ